MRVDLILTDIEDVLVRENLTRIQSKLESEPIVRGQWRFVEITVTAARTNYKFPHGFKFVPKDIIQTSLTGAGSLTWNYADFDAENLDLTTSGACVVRAFVGRYAEGV